MMWMWIHMVWFVQGMILRQIRHMITVLNNNMFFAGTYTFIAFLGLIVGSFLNVYILRLNTGKDTKGRSACASCGTKLEWVDLFPVLSFLFLQGKCRSCKSKISYQYPIVEFLNAILYFLIAFYVKDLFLWAPLFFLASLSVIIAVYDFKHHIIPQKLINALTGVTLLVFLYNGYFSHQINHFNFWLSHIFATLIFTTPIFLIWFFSKGSAMGFGDVKLALPLFILLTPVESFTAFTFTFVFGAVY